MAQHVVKVPGIEGVAECRWCNGPVLYVEDETQWAHAASPDADHAVEVMFTIVDPAKRDGAYECGDQFVIEAPEGSWLGEAYDTGTRGWSAFVAAT